MAEAYFAGGCFWCTEAVFESLKGVKSVVSGYAGGKKLSPTYEKVSTGQTGHAETIEIAYDPTEISYSDLLYVFLRTHDPTTLNQQGADIGTQYRSEIFYKTEEEKLLAEKEIKKAQAVYKEPIITKVTKLHKFYEAENYHQNYYKNNQNAYYCKVVIDPKIQKLKKNFRKYLSSNDQ